MDYTHLDSTLETLGQLGCRRISTMLHQIEQDETPEEMTEFSIEERDYLYTELKEVMAVYGNKACDL